ncbi:MAG: preprotein translocase subunit SecE [Proteobacteria bacterium]|nr:preprotein translocase subunit SecE [Pseudomonadota bacterium]
MADKAKLFLAITLMVIAIGAFYYYSGQQTTLVRVLGLLIAAGVAVAIAAQTGVGHTTRGFLLDARTEVRKVVWPARRETVQTTLVVIVVVIVVAILLWLLDMLVLSAVKLLTGRGG